MNDEIHFSTFQDFRFYYNILLFDLFSLVNIFIYFIFMYLNYSLAFLGNTLNFL